MASSLSLKVLLEQAAVKGVAQASARIFGNVFNPTGQRSPHHVLKKKLIGDKVSQYYPQDLRRDNPGYIRMKEEERLEKLEMRKRRGKGPPKKGHGKRAVKRSK